MIPISDSGRPGRGLAYVTIALIVANALVFLYQQTLPARAQDLLLYQYALIPHELLSGADLPPVNPYPLWTTVFTSMFMHGGWSHIIGNMVYLWVFGDNIEDTFGHVPYLAFYVLCGVVAAAAHVWSDPASTVPTLGASGAISGVLGAYLLLYPRNRVNTVVLFGYFARTVTLPAMVVLGFWIVLQLFNSLIMPGGGGGVAYWAHIGGFAAGIVLAAPAWLLRRGKRQDQW